MQRIIMKTAASLLVYNLGCIYMYESSLVSYGCRPLDRYPLVSLYCVVSRDLNPCCKQLVDRMLNVLCKYRICLLVLYLM